MIFFFEKHYDILNCVSILNLKNNRSLMTLISSGAKWLVKIIESMKWQKRKTSKKDSKKYGDIHHSKIVESRTPIQLPFPTYVSGPYYMLECFFSKYHWFILNTNDSRQTYEKYELAVIYFQIILNKAFPIAVHTSKSWLVIIKNMNLQYVKKDTPPWNVYYISNKIDDNREHFYWKRSEENVL